MNNGDDGIAIEVRNGVSGCEDSDVGRENKAWLKDVNVEIKKRTLTAVVGTVGSGKSSSLSCLLSEMHKISGKVTYALWNHSLCGTNINATIRDIILFGLPMDNKKYKESIHVCCLEKDMEIMEFGDQTEIGEKDINLSGGQKQRIQLARAVYQDSDIYLLDDVFTVYKFDDNRRTITYQKNNSTVNNNTQQFGIYNA